MSAVIPLQDRILSVLRENAPIRQAEMSRWLPDVDHIHLDVGLNALMRDNKVSLAMGAYDLVDPLEGRPRQKNGKLIAVAVAGTGATPTNSHPWDQRVSPGEKGMETPSAALEAAASLDPQTSQLFPCERCKEPQPHGAYRHSALGKRFRVCKRCDAELRGNLTRKSQLNTPSGHPPVVNPQTVNPAGTSVESMEQDGSAPTPARAIESLPTSPTSPAAGSVAAGQLSWGTDHGFTAIERKLESLLAQKEAAEAKLAEVTRQLRELDETVRKLQVLVPEAFV